MTDLLNINQYNTDKQSSGKKLQKLIKKIPEVSSLVTATVPDRKIDEAERKIPDVSGFATTTVLGLLLFLIQKLEKLRIRHLVLVI